MRTISARTSSMTGGRPGPRRALPSYCCAIKRRCQARRHNCGDVPEETPSECLGLRRQATTLSVRESQPSGAELFPQGAVLLLEVVDDGALLLVDRTSGRDEHEPQRMGRLSQWPPRLSESWSSFAWRPIHAHRLRQTASVWGRSYFWTVRGQEAEGS